MSDLLLGGVWTKIYELTRKDRVCDWWADSDGYKKAEMTGGRRTQLRVGAGKFSLGHVNLNWRSPTKLGVERSSKVGRIGPGSDVVVRACTIFHEWTALAENAGVVSGGSLKWLNRRVLPVMCLHVGKSSEVGRIHPISDFMDRVFTIFHELAALAENVGMISGGSLKVPNCVLFILTTITHRVKWTRLKGIAFNGMRSMEASSEKCSNGLVGGRILFCS